MKLPASQFLILASAAWLACLGASGARAHPHVFAEANLEVVVDEDEKVRALRHVWRFDDLFSSTVMFEFDANRDLELDNEELETVGSVIHESLADFGYFQLVEIDGSAVEMRPPEHIIASFEDELLTIAFESEPVDPFALEGTAGFGVYDPTFYTAIDFYDDDQLVVSGMPERCEREVIRPDPDEALAMNQDTLTDDFFNEPGGVDYNQLFATRLEIDCSAQG